MSATTASRRAARPVPRLAGGQDVPTAVVADGGYGVHHVVRSWGADPWLDDHVLAFRDALGAGGIRSAIFVVEDPAANAEDLSEVGGGPAWTDPTASVDTHPLTTYGAHAAPGDALVLHLGVDGLREPLPDDAGPVVLDVHGLVEPTVMERWSPVTARRSAATLDEISRWRRRVALALVSSVAEAALLADRGVGPVAVVPGMVQPERVQVVPDERARRRLRAADEEPGAVWVTVGPIGPASGMEDVIGGLWACRRLHDPAAHLHVVGPVAPAPFLLGLRALCTELGLEDAVRWAARVPPSQEAAYLEAADVVVDLARADPWRIGTRRALVGGRPVLTWAHGPAAAIAGLAAVALAGQGAAVVGTAAHRLATDAALGARLAAASRRRAAALAPSSLGAALVALVESALHGGAD